MAPVENNPYEAPQAAGDAKPSRVRIRWWRIVVSIFILGLLVGLLLPALQAPKSTNERQYREWKRQQQEERENGTDSANGVAAPGL